MNSLRHIVAIVCLLLFGIAKPAAAEDLPKGEDADVKEIVFGHIGDAYGWHITTWGETHVTVPLPVIVRSKTGHWNVFSSSRLDLYKGTCLELTQKLRKLLIVNEHLDLNGDRKSVV